MTEPIDDLLAAHRALEAETASVLRASGLDYVREASVGGQRFDFVVTDPKLRRTAVLEIKSLTFNKAQMVKRAAELARRAKEESAADVAFLVVPHPIPYEGEIAETGVRMVTVGGLRDALEAVFVAFGPVSGPPKPKPQPASGRTLLAAMPFSPQYDDTFFVAIVGACEELGLAARRIDQEDYVGDIVRRIKEAILASRIVIADLSENRVNVAYEMGLAHGAGVDVVPISSGKAAALPFNLSHENVLFYELGRTAQLRPTLARRLRQVLR
jgi:hypothetical protein